MIKGIIFDLDNTLYSYDLCNEAAMVHVLDYAAKAGIEKEQFLSAFAQGKQAVKECLGSNCAATHNRLLYFQKTLEILNRNPLCEAMDFYNQYWDHFLENMKLFDGAIDFLSQLKEKGIQMAICTDLTSHIQYRKIRKLGLDSYIHILVTSEEVGVEKPDSKMFLTALQKMELKPEECTFIGDDLKKDIIGASNVSIEPILLSQNPDGAYQCVRSFRELFDAFDFNNQLWNWGKIR